MHTITIRIAGAVNTYNVADVVAFQTQRAADSLRRRGIDVVSVTPVVVHDDFCGFLNVLSDAADAARNDAFKAATL